ncbi:hypothetical protein AVEN_269087-1 [Araneus ventricosus]|uniref:Uncharacterized protein n=1 Tax=Araneus ventricosus TaxID=182803 RepID=A0A4Y2JI61_ARAVE|nr:hypothetical protein AVEN_269087-1 [Araneus ventricosus]
MILTRPQDANISSGMTSILITLEPQGRGGLVVGSRPFCRRVPGSQRDSSEDRRVWGLLHSKSYEVAKRPPVGVGLWFKITRSIPKSPSCCFKTGC